MVSFKLGIQLKYYVFQSGEFLKLERNINLPDYYDPHVQPLLC